MKKYKLRKVSLWVLFPLFLAPRLGLARTALLFGMLYQGGTELAFDQPKITRDMIVVIQGLVVLFAGALEGVFRKPLARLFSPRPAATTT